ncbi:MAG: efflux RND transporter periplasmic adaptor subunit [Candidatus Cloacimonetes bacterium]|nr:efflux RND transporter periplasmic adaptor subunit [Candidatus Cloacimonadota bacterium]
MKISCYLLVLSIFLSSCRFTDLFRKKADVKETVNSTYTITVPVKATPAVSGDLVKTLKSSGIVEASARVQMISEISGIIVDVSVRENQRISRDAVVLRLDRKEIELDLAQAELELERAAAEYKAWKKMSGNSDDEQLKLQTGLKAAELNWQKLSIAAAKTEIRMPFDGIITGFTLTPGEFVNSGQKLGTAFNLDELLLRVNVMESEINRIKPGAEARIRFPAIQQKIYYGKVESISPTVESAARTCEVLIRFANDGLIRDGMYADVKIAAEVYPNNIIIHKDALLVRDGKKLVFTVADGKAKWQYVETGRENDYFVAVTQGVEEQQLVVIDGNFSLSHDASVELIETIPYSKLAARF